MEKQKYIDPDKCDICKRIGEGVTIRQKYDGTWPDTDLGLIDKGSFKICPKCSMYYSVYFHPGGIVSDDDIELCRIGRIESEILGILSSEGPKDVVKLEELLREHLKTKGVYFLISKACADLTPLIPIAIKLLKENDKENKREGIKILNSAALGRSDILQSIPVLITIISSDKNQENRWTALSALRYAAKNGLDISQAISEVSRTLSSNDTYATDLAGEVLFYYHIKRGEYEKVKKLLKEKPRAVLRFFLDAAEAGLDISSFIVDIINLLPKGIKLCSYPSDDRDVSCQFQAVVCFINQKQKNARLVLDGIKNAKNNKRLLEVRELTKKCEELLRGPNYDNTKGRN